MTLFGIDNAYPISPKDAKDAKADVVFVYVGGINNGGRAWKPNHAKALFDAKILSMPIYVGANFGYNMDNLSYAGGIKEGQDAIECAKKYGFNSGYLFADLEYGTFENRPTMTAPYADGWVQAITDEGTFIPAIYGTSSMAKNWRPNHPCGFWVASWLNSPAKPSLDDIPYVHFIHNFSANAWQYYSGYMGRYDASILDDNWFKNVSSDEEDFGMINVGRVTKDEKHRVFDETGHSISGGFRAFYEHFGKYALELFGYPISEEFDDSDKLRVQWFERARFEWIKDSNPELYDVQLGLLGSESYEAAEDRKKFTDAFKKVDYK